MAKGNSTAVTNIFSGRPARSIMNRIMKDIGPMSDWPTSFPNAGSALAPLKRAAETEERSDFSSLWSGQSVGLSQEMGTADLTRKLANDALGRFSFKD